MHKISKKDYSILLHIINKMNIESFLKYVEAGLIISAITSYPLANFLQSNKHAIRAYLTDIKRYHNKELPLRPKLKSYI